MQLFCHTAPSPGGAPACAPMLCMQCHGMARCLLSQSECQKRKAFQRSYQRDVYCGLETHRHRGAGMARPLSQEGGGRHVHSLPCGPRQEAGGICGGSLAHRTSLQAEAPLRFSTLVLSADLLIKTNTLSMQACIGTCIGVRPTLSSNDYKLSSSEPQLLAAEGRAHPPDRVLAV